MSRPAWVHVSARGKPLPTIENVAAVLDWFCTWDGACIQTELYRKSGVDASRFCPTKWVVEFGSKCASFEIPISDRNLRRYLSILLGRAVGVIDDNDWHSRHIKGLLSVEVK